MHNNKNKQTDMQTIFLIVVYLSVSQTAFRGYQNKKYKSKISFVIPEEPKAQVNKTGINLMIFILILWKIVCNMIICIIFHYG